MVEISYIRNLAIVSLFGCLFFAGCSEQPDYSAYNKLTDKWPLVVKEGKVGCDSPKGRHNGKGFGAAYFRHKGAKYALNGIASNKGYRPIEKLSLGQNISPLLNLALEEC